MTRLSCLALCIATLSLVAAPLVAGPTTRTRSLTPNFAPTWEDAVAAGRALNVPIVIHGHGFFDGASWATHKALLESSVYATFANENSVEVVVMKDAERAFEEDVPNAATAKATDGKGDDTAYLVRFPGLEREQLLGLANSDAAKFGKGLRVPHTIIVNPHTLRVMRGVSSKVLRGRQVGQVTPEDLMRTIARARTRLRSQYGPGVDRSRWDEIAGAMREMRLLLKSGKLAEAMGVYRLIGRRSMGQADSIKALAKTAMEKIVAAATPRLEALEKAAAPKEKRDRLAAANFARSLRGTPLEVRGLKLLEKLG